MRFTLCLMITLISFISEARMTFLVNESDRIIYAEREIKDIYKTQANEIELIELYNGEVFYSQELRRIDESELYNYGSTLIRFSSGGDGSGGG